jgi:sporulation protein YlmC with PRC-barrel domain
MSTASRTAASRVARPSYSAKRPGPTFAEREFHDHQQLRSGNGNPQAQRGKDMTTASGHTRAIRAKKVIGTNVNDTTGHKIGEIQDVMLDKASSNIMFAVVGFGGFLGVAEKYHPIPWSALHYSDAENAYVVNYTKAQLQAAPAASIEELTRNDGLPFRDQSFEYYKAERYW